MTHRTVIFGPLDDLKLFFILSSRYWVLAKDGTVDESSSETESSEQKRETSQTPQVKIASISSVALYSGQRNENSLIGIMFY